MRWPTKKLPGPWKRRFALFPTEIEGRMIWFETYWARFLGMYHDATFHEVALCRPVEADTTERPSRAGRTT